MKTITTYIADDGTEFDDEYDCREYENALSFKNFKGIMLDEDFKKTEKIEGAFYLYIPTEEDQNIFKKRSQYEGFDYPTTYGFFRYNVFTDCYVDVEEEYKNSKTILTALGYDFK